MKRFLTPFLFLAIFLVIAVGLDAAPANHTIFFKQRTSSGVADREVVLDRDVTTAAELGDSLGAAMTVVPSVVQTALDAKVSSYSYIVYASDASGTGFTTTFNSALDYVAMKTTTSPLSPPVAGDFTGLWKRYKGDAGADGLDGSDGAPGSQILRIPTGTPTGGVDGDWAIVVDTPSYWQKIAGVWTQQFPLNEFGLITASVVDAASLLFTEAAAPATPAAGKVTIYAKTDGLLYGKDDAGVETKVSNEAAGSGDVVGPASSTDNAIARFDSTTGKLLQNSSATLSDVGEIAVPTGATTGITIHNQADQVTNYERLKLNVETNVFKLRSEAGGTGTARNIELSAGSGMTITMRTAASTSANLAFAGANSTVANSVGYSFSPGNQNQSSGTSRGIALATTVNQSSTGGYVDFSVERTQTAVGTGIQQLMRAQVGGTSYWIVDNEGVQYSRGDTYVATQYDATTTTLAAVTNLTANVKAAVAYAFEADLYVDADATGGHKYAISGTATATSIIYQIDSIRNSTGAYTITSRQTALGGAAGEASGAAYHTRITGTIVVNAGGTLVVQFAQNAANGTSSVLVGSTFRVWRLN